ncbi:hypothetical protein [Microcella sp.]|uniref:hypothetical protein n=1 Tax=Microcella sp. TaxID=1913979 RepID=UPI00391DBA89
MTDERDRDDETGAFDADEWFRTQFGGEAEEKPAPEPVAPPVLPPVPPAAQPPVAPPVLPPAQPPVEPSAFPALPAQPPVVPPPVAPSAFPPPPPPPPLVEPVAFPAPAAGQPSFPDPGATQPIIEPEPTQPAEVVPPVGDAATELLREPEQGGALDELFGDTSFQEYDETLIPAAPRASRRADGEPTADAARAPIGRTQKILLWVAGSLVAVLALVAIFALGTRIPLLLGPAPGALPSPTPSPTPVETDVAAPVGPVAPGEYRWDELLGGECLEPFIDAWQETYTVVDCTVLHTAQLVFRGTFPLPEGSEVQGPFPGEEALAAQIPVLCSAPGVIDLDIAGAVDDLQVQGSFPVTAEEWDAGQNDYFCFASRASGELLRRSIAVAPSS